MCNPACIWILLKKFIKETVKTWGCGLNSLLKSNFLHQHGHGCKEPWFSELSIPVCRGLILMRILYFFLIQKSISRHFFSINLKPKKLNRQSGEIIFCKIFMTSIEKPIEIGLQMVGNRYEATGVAFDFYCSRFSNEFFGLK